MASAQGASRRAHGSESRVLGSRQSPPGGWLATPELPSPEEILQPSVEQEAVPLAPVHLPWATKEAYLEAQYKILRKEATEGLRYAVNEYRRDPGMSDNDLVLIYTDVFVKGYTMCRPQPACKVSFTTRRAGRKINWSLSRRLQPATAVAISTKANNFQSICKIAIVAQRPMTNGLDQNPPQIDIFWANADDAVFDPDQELVMIESRNGYFEAARYALMGLQAASRIDSPLDKYIVQGSRADLSPAYVHNGPVLNLTELIRNHDAIGEDTRNHLQAVNILSHAISNDGHVKLASTMDQSQLDAVQRILSKELAIIQGPPGTGKTFTSVEAIKVLLANRKSNDPPILVACQTNHALDQLLLHCAPHAEIMRIGGRTEDEHILARTVYNLRQNFRGQKTNQVTRLEKDRCRNGHMFSSVAEDAFSDVLSTEALVEAGMLTPDQAASLEDEDIAGENDSEDEDEDDSESKKKEEDLGRLASWLGSELVPGHLSRAVLHLPHFLEEEVEEEDDEVLDEEEHDDKSGKFAVKNDDENCLRGTWVPMEYSWTGKEPREIQWQARYEKLLGQTKDLYEISANKRGGIYRLLQRKMLEFKTPALRKLLQENIALCDKVKLARWASDKELVRAKRIDLIGCTTTGLTKYRGFLTDLSPRILLIEEAAETRESNITSAICPSLQQLILVGDHQQLTPHCDVKWLEDAPYNLKVSLFERLVNLNLPFKQLNVQRRMVPDIRSILQPFYPSLTDHPLVCDPANRPPVPGLPASTWLFHHTYAETTDVNMSKYNEFEADMVVNFAVYLNRNGMAFDKITILTFYSGQQKLIRDRLRKHDAIRAPNARFKVHTVDSYQGEENDVVMLSLVRSPRPDAGYAVGFLEDKNRAVVAISRARRGFYVFGNMDNVFRSTHASYALWGSVWNGFATLGTVRREKGLPVVCQNHSTITWIKDVRDWDYIVGGGCTRPCDQLRACGHRCELTCHVAPHDALPCMQPCQKQLECGDRCAQLCSEKCSCPCGQYSDMMEQREREEKESQELARQLDQEASMSLEELLLAGGVPRSQMLLATLREQPAPATRTATPRGASSSSSSRAGPAASARRGGFIPASNRGRGQYQQQRSGPWAPRGNGKRGRGRGRGSANNAAERRRFTEDVQARDALARQDIMAAVEASAHVGKTNTIIQDSFVPTKLVGGVRTVAGQRELITRTGEKESGEVLTEKNNKDEKDEGPVSALTAQMDLLGSPVLQDSAITVGPVRDGAAGKKKDEEELLIEI